jgi:hypothetical protein
MKLTLSFLLLISIIWPPIASVTAIDEHDDPRNIQARIFRVEARADFSSLRLW